jgi:hypothetical protein
VYDVQKPSLKRDRAGVDIGLAAEVSYSAVFYFVVSSNTGDNHNELGPDINGGKDERKKKSIYAFHNETTSAMQKVLHVQPLSFSFPSVLPFLLI